jgi:hypothetical protein
VLEPAAHSDAVGRVQTAGTGAIPELASDSDLSLAAEVSFLKRQVIE